MNAGADDGSDAASAATATAWGGAAAASEVYVACTPLVGLEAMGAGAHTLVHFSAQLRTFYGIAGARRFK